jgi:hypothetical protein
MLGLCMGADDLFYYFVDVLIQRRPLQNCYRDACVLSNKLDLSSAKCQEGNLGLPLLGVVHVGRGG